METLTPTNRLDPRVKTAWRIQAALGLGIAALVAAAFGAALWTFGSGGALAAVPLLLTVGAAALWLTVVPAVRYARWRWDVTEHEVRLQRGLIVVERTVIPMVRVQHVDTSQGPIMGAFDLSEVRVWTAAGSHSIPALAEKDAAALRDRIAVLARVTDDGGL